MKLLSIAIPSYNSEKYMRNCIESLLPGGEEVEILIVNDGSKDGTAAIADEYHRYLEIDDRKATCLLLTVASNKRYSSIIIQ